MLSLLNKSGGDKSGPRVIPWRPDFRDASSLPDTKTVRTHFFVNLVAASVTSALLIYVVQREFGVASLRESLADVDTRIAAATPLSEKAQAAYKLFQAEEAKFNESFAFVRTPFRFHGFILHLGEIMPPGVAVRRIDHRGVDQAISLVGAVRGTDAAAGDVASNFVKQLQSDPALAQHFAAIELTNLGRNAQDSSLNLELLFTFKGNPALKGGAKK
jgi:hypothetical protein